MSSRAARLSAPGTTRNARAAPTAAVAAGAAFCSRAAKTALARCLGREAGGASAARRQSAAAATGVPRRDRIPTTTAAARSRSASAALPDRRVETTRAQRLPLRETFAGAEPLLEREVNPLDELDGHRVPEHCVRPPRLDGPVVERPQQRLGYPLELDSDLLHPRDGTDAAAGGGVANARSSPRMPRAMTRREPQSFPYAVGSRAIEHVVTSTSARSALGVRSIVSQPGHAPAGC